MPSHRAVLLSTLLSLALLAPAAAQGLPPEAQIGPRPFYLVDKMKDGPLKQKLSQCTGPFRKTDFSIGHRGAALQFPEHTKESYAAAARMGAGVIECDVTFTKDRQLVCRHSQCDLHTTTNILSMPALAAKCSMPFIQADPATGRKASAKCCTSDITLAEFRTLSAKMDGFNPNATNVADYSIGGAGTNKNWTFSRVVRCAAGDTLAVQARSSIAGCNAYGTAASKYTYIDITLVGG